MSKSYQDIISIIKGDIDNLERAIVEDVMFPTEALNNLLLAPAKRIRPVLAFLFLKSYGHDITEEQLQIQVAVELAHTASLIHDDIVDFSNNRRGLQTLNTQYSDKVAVLTGDYILSVALKKLVSINDSIILNDFLNTFSQMASGEISQYFTKHSIPSLEDYINKTIKKTAGLFEISLKSASRLAQENINLWADFAINFGIAFQIKNDLKDVLTDNNDIKNGIYTAPVIFSNSTSITQDAIEKTKQLANDYLINAQNILKILPQNDYSKALKEILELYKND